MSMVKLSAFSRRLSSGRRALPTADRPWQLIMTQACAAIGFDDGREERFDFASLLDVRGCADDPWRIGEHEVHQRVNPPGDVVLDHDFALEAIIAAELLHREQARRQSDALCRRAV
jgi:hypothetical protein